MPSNFGVYDITGEYQAVASSTLPGTHGLRTALSGSRLVGSFVFNGSGIVDDDVIVVSATNASGSRVGDIVRYTKDTGKVAHATITEVGFVPTGTPFTAGFVYFKAGLPPGEVSHFNLSASIDVLRRPQEIDEGVLTVNNRRRRQRKLYDRLILGRAFRYEVGESAVSGTVLNISGSSPFGLQRASPPSWTQIPIGKHHEMVINELSSSYHEIVAQNARFSGTQALENTAVPASASLYYSKATRFVRSIYKLSASVNLPVLPASQDHTPAADENLSRTGSNGFIPGSGSYRNTTIFNPSVFEIEVPEYGKIRDIKVWVELIHDHRGGKGTGSFGGNPFLKGGSGATGSYAKQGLQGIQLALRSPNVTFVNSHPLWNDPQTSGFQKWPKASLNQQFRIVPELLRSSYLLWAGHACEEDLGMSLGRETASLPDTTFTVFQQATASLNYSYSPGPGFPFQQTRGISIDALGGSYDFIYPTYESSDGSSNIIQGGNTFAAPVPSQGSTVGRIWTPPTSLRLRRRTDGSLVALAQGQNPGFWLFQRPGGGGVPWMGSFGNPSLHGASVTPTITDAANDFNDSSTATVTGLSGMLTSDIGKILSFTAGTFTNAANNKEFLIRDYVSANSVIVQTFTSVSETAPSAFTFAVKNTVGNKIARLGGFDGNCDMALDRSGVIHLVGSAWRGDLGNRVLNYGFSGSASNLNGPLAIEAVDTRVIHSQTANVGEFAQIEIDVSNRIHIVYQDWDNNAVKYATKIVDYTSPMPTGGGFTYTSVFSASFAPGHLSLAINPIDQSPAIAWWVYDGTTDRIYYASSGSNGWATELVGTFPNIGKGTRLIFDTNGKPFISSIMPHANGLDRDATFVFASSSYYGWSPTVIPVTASFQFTADDTAIAMDLNGAQHILTLGDLNQAAFYGIDNSSLYTAYTTNGVPLGKYFEYDTDIDMRTVFDDASRVPNPRHLEKYFTGIMLSSVSGSVIPGSFITQEGAYPSPSSASINIVTDPAVTGGSISYFFFPTLSRNTHLTGANFPWMLDDRIPPGNFYGRNYYSLVSSSLGLSPPPGWLSGPGGTANTNEFPTTGSNLGPKTMQPVYPLLDDVYVAKIVDQPQLTTEVVTLVPSGHGKIVGFRPGLRGTEVHGKWKLLVGVAGDETGGNVVGNPRAGFFFRQLRLEFLLDKGEGVQNTSYVSKGRRFRKPGYVPTQSGYRLVHLMSGSAAWDIGVNAVYTSRPEEYGRATGITDTTGSTNFAVFTQLTGAFVTALSASGKLDGVRSTFLGNEFRTPFIPISSGSGEAPTFDAFTSDDAVASRKVFQQVLNPTTLIPKDNTLRAFLARSKVTLTTRDSILKKIKK